MFYGHALIVSGEALDETEAQRGKIGTDALLGEARAHLARNFTETMEALRWPHLAEFPKFSEGLSKSLDSVVMQWDVETLD